MRRGGALTGKTWSASWLARVAALLICAYSLQQATEMLLRSVGALERPGTLGLSIERSPPERWPALTVSRVRAGGPADQAGIAVGDAVVFEDRLTPARLPNLTVGETVRLSVDGRPVSLVAEARKPLTTQQAWSRVFFVLGVMLPGLLGVLILLRARSTRSSLLLGASLGCFAVPDYAPQVLAAAPPVFALFNAVGWGMALGSSLLFPAFAISLVEETTGAAWRKAWAWLAGWGAIEGLVLVSAASMTTVGMALPGGGDSNAVAGLIVMPSYLAAMAIMALGMRKADPNTRRRYWLLIGAVSSVMTALIVSLVSLAVLAQTYGSPLQMISNLLCGPLATALFGYAILRQRVVDLGFALNRTLVYGLTSGVVLIAFGLTEWGVENVVKIKGVEENILLDAGLALGLFLTFHRLQEFIEHTVEKLFFRGWHARAAALKRFTREAHFIEDPTTLKARAGAALSAYAGGAPVAIYVASAEEGYVADDALLGPAALDLDDAAAVRLRADTAVTRLAGLDTALRGDLAIPFLGRNQVLGFVVMGGKLDGDAYRPDEVQNLAEAMLSLGNDLQLAALARLQAQLAERDAVIAHQDRRLNALAGLAKARGGAKAG